MKTQTFQIIMFFLLIAGIGDTLTTFWGLSLPAKTEIEYITMPNGDIVEHQVSTHVYEKLVYFIPFLSTLIMAFATLAIIHLGEMWHINKTIKNVIIVLMIAVTYYPLASNFLLIWRW